MTPRNVLAELRALSEKATKREPLSPSAEDVLVGAEAVSKILDALPAILTALEAANAIDLTALEIALNPRDPVHRKIHESALILRASLAKLTEVER